MAITFPIGERQYHNVLYKKLRKTWYDMNQRCYNPKHQSYRFYGAKGVTVCDDWRTLDGFLETVDTVDGWDEDAYIKETFHLDKDIKIEGNKIYSPQTCMFVKPEENFKPTYEVRMRECKAVSPKNEVFMFKNREEFCRQHSLNPLMCTSVSRGSKVTTRVGSLSIYTTQLNLKKLP
ncbi:hypothetical protein [Bacillus phage phiAGATE]|uniref:Uncharacterized protein n=1 Tax=Bacillus phage phiAGATE TaxID=1204533 RepID=L0LAH2_9CAUD|nr:HNH endonuclease [Bacillus phage phiAGATE]AGB62742.1 hypothetical protein [Bacillus phage phiAGATE]